MTRQEPRLRGLLRQLSPFGPVNVSEESRSLTQRRKAKLALSLAVAFALVAILLLIEATVRYYTGNDRQAIFPTIQGLLFVVLAVSRYTDGRKALRASRR